MSLVMLTGPAAEPVTLAEAKAFLRVDGTAEDALVQSLIATSRLHIEAALSLALVSQRWRLTLDAWPGDRLALPLRPVLSVEAVRVKDAGGTPTTLESTRYLLDGHGVPPRLIATATPLPNPGVKAGGIEIDLTAGFGTTPGDVPGPIRQALLMLVAHWYENREPVADGPAVRIPDGVSELLMPYRRALL